MKRINILMVITLMSMLVITGCGCSNEDEKNNKDYANNEVVNSTQQPSVSTTMRYNPQEDANKKKVKSFDEISVDGHMIKIPTDYKSIAEIFKLYVPEGKVPQEISGDTVGTTILTKAYPESGEGIINFEFSGKNKESMPLKDMNLTKINLTSGSYAGKECMSIALPKNIKFDASLQDIKDAFGEPSKYINYNEQSYSVIYNLDDMKVTFGGINGGLHTVMIEFEE